MMFSTLTGCHAFSQITSYALIFMIWTAPPPRIPKDVTLIFNAFRCYLDACQACIPRFSPTPPSLWYECDTIDERLANAMCDCGVEDSIFVVHFTDNVLQFTSNHATCELLSARKLFDTENQVSLLFSPFPCVSSARDSGNCYFLQLYSFCGHRDT